MQSLQLETEVERQKQKIGEMNFRHLLDELCDSEDDAEILRVAKKWIRLRNEEFEEFADELERYERATNTN